MAESGFDFSVLTGAKREGAGVEYVEILEEVPAEVIARYGSIPGLATAVMAKSNGTLSVRTIDGVVHMVRTAAHVAAAWQASRGTPEGSPLPFEENDLTSSPWDD